MRGAREGLHHRTHRKKAARMRTTLDIDDDILVAAKELARRQACSVGRVVSLLTRQALTQVGTDGSGSSGPVSPGPGTPGVGGFRPFFSRGAPVTNTAIDALRDDEGA